MPELPDVETFKRYWDGRSLHKRIHSWIIPQRDKVARCPRCGGEIEKITVCGRTTYYCARHQPAHAMYIELPRNSL
jgi:formamidopyrimidine-DNA glycosylase